MLICIVLYCVLLEGKQIAGDEVFNQNIISQSMVKIGESFTVICDASHLNIETTYTTVSKLVIKSELSFMSEEKIIASYSSYIPPYIVSFPPQDRNWSFNFSGSQSGSSEKPNNKDTMKIEIVVFDALCDDDGYYKCDVVFIDENDLEKMFSVVEYLSIKTKFRYGNIVIEPQYTDDLRQYESFNPAGSLVNLTCTGYGPEGLQFRWKFGKSSSDVESFKPFTVEPREGSDGLDFMNIILNCDYTFQWSKVTFQTEIQYDGYMYVCVVTENNTDTIVGSATIHTKLLSEFSLELVNQSVVEEGGSFTVTCDASRAGVPEDSSSLVSLTLGWAAGPAPPTTFAEYNPYEAPNYFTIPPQSIPSTNLSFEFSGGLKETNDSLNKTDSMKIEMVAYNAKCSDGGLFFCNATYLNSFNDTISTHRKQDISFIKQDITGSVTLFPNYSDKLHPYEATVNEGVKVIFGCVVNGPKDLSIKWLYGNARKDVSSFKSFPVENITVSSWPVKVSSSTYCFQYNFSSTLNFNMENMYDGYMFVCVTTANNRDTIVGDMTLNVEQDTTTPHTIYSADIVRPKVLVEGGSLTVTCDASLAGVPTNIFPILKLTLAWTNGTKVPRLLAKYNTFNYPNIAKFPPVNPLRNWSFIFNGSLKGTSDTPNNRETMKIVIMIYNASKADEGVYFCNATYVQIETNLEKTAYRSQSLRNETNTEPLSSQTDEYSFLFYVLPVGVVVVVVVVVVTAVCIRKVHRARAIKRRRELMTLPAISGADPSPPMDSNGYLLPVDPNGGYAQVSDIEIYETSPNYYSSINELDFVIDSAASDEQSENSRGLQQNQVDDVNKTSDIDVMNDKQHDNNSDKQRDTEKQNDSIPTDELHDYTKLYDTPEDNVYSPDVNKYLALNVESFI